VTLRHTDWKRDEIAGYGCGWHHYVDALSAHLDGLPLPSFDDYYPAFLPHWRPGRPPLRLRASPRSWTFSH
jgi:hypothetical protein